MSKARTYILLGTDSFYDKDVQNLLCTKRDPAVNPNVPDAVVLKREMLAWPLIAFYAANDMYEDWNIDPGTPGESFYQCYSFAPVFMADLLQHITRYYKLPEGQWSIDRKIIHYANSTTMPMAGMIARLKETNFDFSTFPLAEYKTIVSDFKDSNGNPLFSESMTGDEMRKRFSKIRKGRHDINRLWSANKKALSEMQQSKTARIPLSFRFFKPE